MRLCAALRGGGHFAFHRLYHPLDRDPHFLSEPDRVAERDLVLAALPVGNRRIGRADEPRDISERQVALGTA